MTVHRIGLLVACLVGVVLAGGRISSAADDPGVRLRLSVRDSETGRAVVPYSLAVDGTEMAARVTASGRADLHLPAGDYRVAVRAKGYRDLTARLTVVDGDAPLNVLLLDPVATAPELQPEALGCFAEPGAAVFTGFVVDDATGMPLEGVEVVAAAAGATVTDRRGFFAMAVSLADGAPVPGDDRGTLFAKTAIMFSKPAFARQVWHDVLAVAGETRVFRVRLVAGTTADVTTETAGRGRLLGSLFDGCPAIDESHDASASVPAPMSDGPTPEPLGQAAPTTIRVGRNCPTKTTCTTVETMSIETYAKHVLPAEWFSSWNAESLKAGAVAIRSYGGWHVYHPLTATYDICDTSACQVYKDATSASANAAVDATAGIYVVDAAGNIARTEYSAENNNSGTCGDCYLINNPSGPCLYDPVCCGSSTNGHGRGMCQWGTQRWAANQGKTFEWIVDHYYAGFGWTRRSLTGPTITQQPVAQRVCPGTTATFTVAAVGQGTLTYRWRKNGVSLNNDGHYSGVTTATLIVTNADAADVADYRCVVTDSGGSTESDPAALTLKATTAIDRQPTAASVCPGGAATFSVTATGEGTLTYRWEKNGTTLSDGGHYAGTTTATLTVSGADAGDAADYRCVVTAGCGSATSNAAALSLKAATAILEPPQPQTVDAGGLAAFSVVAVGSGTITYRWQKAGVDLADGGRYSGTTTATLTIADVGKAEAGTYRCIVTAECGTLASAEAALTVILPLSQKADFDGDGDVDLTDFSFFQMCFNGPNAPSPLPECGPADIQADGDVDLGDFALFQTCFNGPNRPPACE